jgi:phosphatidylglycerol:prolipoprotein diacylglycerol transferase
MYVLDFNPTVLKIGFIDIRWYSVIYAASFLLFYFYLRYLIKKKLIGLDKERAESFLIYSIIGTVLGARLAYFLFYDITTLFSDPLELFKVWHGGLSFHGGLIGFITAVIIFTKRHKAEMWKLLDISALFAIFALMLGRIGNILNGEIPGTPFDGAWCTVFPLYDNTCRHPYPAYAFISHLILLAYLAIIIYTKRKELKDFIGKRIIAANFLIGYGISRIITDIWKADAIFSGAKTGQWLSILMVIIGLIILFVRKKR